MLAAIMAVAFLYSSVGHGGATGYLATAALLGLSPVWAKPGALWMNCVVSGIAFWRFRRAGLFDLNVFVPLATASIPLAWLGSRLLLEGRAYAWLLAGALIAAGWSLGQERRPEESAQIRSPNWSTAMLAGGVEAPVVPLGLGGFGTMRALSRYANREARYALARRASHACQCSPGCGGPSPTTCCEACAKRPR